MYWWNTWRHVVGALAAGLFTFSLIASVAAQSFLSNRNTTPRVVGAPLAASTPVQCVGTLSYFRAHTLHSDGWPKVIVALDITRADRCAGQFGQPVARLHGFFVITSEKLAVRTELRTNNTGYWMQVCQRLRADCLDVNTVIRWTPTDDEA